MAAKVVKLNPDRFRPKHASGKPKRWKPVSNMVARRKKAKATKGREFFLYVLIAALVCLILSGVTRDLFPPLFGR
ncbi:MAG: hypothetical protein AAB367_00275 [Patescibacteria group bacterium]